MTKTITRESSRWEVTERAHDGACAYCDAAEQSAVTHAIITGCAAGCYVLEYADIAHSAYVERKN